MRQTRTMSTVSDTEFAAAVKARWKAGGAQLLLLPPSNALRHVHTMLLDPATPTIELTFFLRRVLRMLIGRAMEGFLYTECAVTTPSGKPYDGLELAEPICAATLMRYGSILHDVLRQCVKSCAIGHILVRKEADGAAQYYAKFPRYLSAQRILLVDLQVISGATATKAVDVLVEHGAVSYCTESSHPTMTLPSGERTAGITRAMVVWTLAGHPHVSCLKVGWSDRYAHYCCGVCTRYRERSCLLRYSQRRKEWTYCVELIQKSPFVWLRCMKHGATMTSLWTSSPTEPFKGSPYFNFPTGLAIRIFR